MSKSKPKPNDDNKPFELHEWADANTDLMERMQKASKDRDEFKRNVEKSYAEYKDGWLSKEEREKQAKEDAKKEEEKKAEESKKEEKKDDGKGQIKPGTPAKPKKDYLHRLASHMSFKTSNRLKDSKSKSKKKKKLKKKVYA